MTADVEANPDFLLTPERLEAWEREHGRIPRGAWVLLRTGWSRRSGTAAVINAGADGPHSPGFEAPHLDAARQATATCSGSGWRRSAPMPGRPGRFTRPFPNHTIMHGAGKFGLASLCNLDQLPPTGAVVIAAPLKIVERQRQPAAGDRDHAVTGWVFLLLAELKLRPHHRRLDVIVVGRLF